MADSNIGSLPLAAQLDDDSLLVAEQQGQAVKVTGAQFKEFGRQAVIGQVQGYVDQAEAAANRAADAVSAVTDMTVEAATLPSGQNAAVTKTIQNGKVNLAFGLPRGPKGNPGPEGPAGAQGPRGETGKGLTILGYYDTLDDLKEAVPKPDPGDPYGVGAGAPYNIYVFDGVTGTWKNNGPLSGGGGGIMPENIVTAGGGASLTFPLDLGEGPHIVTFTEEEEPPLTAEDVTYSSTENVKQAIDGLKSSVSNGKALVASAIADKGIPTAQDATFRQMANNIGQISGGSDTSDATATSFDILAPKTAYTATGKVEGTIPTLLGQTIVPGTADKTIANGQYLGGTQVIKGDPNLTSSNIKRGVTLFGVDGALESSFKATLTVTADAGAVVTATHTNGTKVEALSTTGTVVLELPLEGTWKVTAVRGVAQYNTVTINVTSQYNAELTAEVHIEYYGEVTPLSSPRYGLSAAAIGDYLLFCGGHNGNDLSDYNATKRVDTYNINLTSSTATALPNSSIYGCAGSTKSHAFISCTTKVVCTYDSALVQGRNSMQEDKDHLAAAAIGDFVLFGGGTYGDKVLSSVDAFNDEMASIVAEPLSIQAKDLAAASNDNYAVFAGGYGINTSRDHATAYDKSITRITPTRLSSARSGLAAANAGNYILFAGGGGPSMVVDAYDLFLTRTTIEPLSVARFDLASASINGYALFGGGKKSGYIDSVSDAMDSYDPYLTKTNSPALAGKRYDFAAGTVGNFAIFAGGEDEKGGSRSQAFVYQHR